VGFGIGLWSGSIRQKKEMYLSELVCMGNHETLSLVIGGDFNILRFSSEKIKTILIIGGHSFLMPLLMVYVFRN
jgi:hypothetical protein